VGTKVVTPEISLISRTAFPLDCQFRVWRTVKDLLDIQYLRQETRTIWMWAADLAINICAVALYAVKGAPKLGRACHVTPVVSCTVWAPCPTLSVAERCEFSLQSDLATDWTGSIPTVVRNVSFHDIVQTDSWGPTGEYVQGLLSPGVKR
jgi:hypothetical protein